MKHRQKNIKIWKNLPPFWELGKYTLSVQNGSIFLLAFINMGPKEAKKDSPNSLVIDGRGRKQGRPVTRQPREPLNLEGRGQAGTGLQACALPEGSFLLGSRESTAHHSLSGGCFSWEDEQREANQDRSRSRESHQAHLVRGLSFKACLLLPQAGIVSFCRALKARATWVIQNDS